VNAADAIDVEARMYEKLFNVEAPDAGDEDFIKHLNPDSLKTISKAKAEPSLAASTPGDKFQFLRMGYFCADKDSTPSKLIFNRTVTLKDTWKPASH
jgi:glutaminyl-tRNA synthetase